MDDNASKRIDYISHLIEFELKNAHDDSLILKKDNIGLILLLVGLLGLLYYIPQSLFLHELFPDAMFFLTGYTFLFILAAYDLIKKDNSSILKKHILVNCLPEGERKNIAEKFYAEFLDKDTVPVLTIFSAIIALYFLISLVAYILSTFSFSNYIQPLFHYDITILVILFLQVILLICIFIMLNNYLYANLKEQKLSSPTKFIIFPLLLLGISIFLIIYGMMENIPPFSHIVADSTYSSQMVNSANTNNDLFIFLATSLYLIIALIVLFDYLMTRVILLKLNEKIEKLNEIKAKIDLFKLSKLESINIQESYIAYLKTKRFSLKVHCIGGFLWFYWPSSAISDDEINEIVKYIQNPF